MDVKHHRTPFGDSALGGGVLEHRVVHPDVVVLEGGDVLDEFGVRHHVGKVLRGQCSADEQQ